MQNPFKYGDVVRGTYFDDRKSETKDFQRKEEMIQILDKELSKTADDL